MTRTDIAFAVNMLSRFATNPGHDHLMAIKRILRYLAATRDSCLRFGPGSQGGLLGYSDSSFSDDPEVSPSREAFVYQLYDGPIIWRSQRQDTFAFSSSEAEDKSASEAAKEGIYLVYVLETMDFTTKALSLLSCS